MFEIDWNKLFSPDIPFLEIFIRGSFIYLSLFVILRLFHRRQAGDLGLSNILVIVLIADASQNGMSGDHQSITSGLILVLTIIFWNFILDYMSYHFDWFEKLTCPAPLPLIKKGRFILKNMRSEMISKDELLSKLRQEGVEHVTEVRAACLEADGKISVIKTN